MILYIVALVLIIFAYYLGYNQGWNKAHFTAIETIEKQMLAEVHRQAERLETEE